MWYYTPYLDFPFDIQLVQGDGEQLTRIIASISGKDPLIDDWTQIKIALPPEKIKLYIRLNVTNESLAFDDTSIDYCDAPHPIPPKTLFSCDFESSCTEKFVSFPEYPYQWSIIKASDAGKKVSQAPPVDFTYDNSSGHYAWLNNYNLIQQGKVGYLAMRTPIDITKSESYCLNFQYYGYGLSRTYNLRIYSWTSDVSHAVQFI